MPLSNGKGTFWMFFMVLFAWVRVLCS